MKTKRSAAILVLFTVVFLWVAIPLHPTALQANAKHSAKGAAIGWYVKRNREHKQPVLDEKLQVIQGKKAFYLDREHGDSCEEKVLYLTFDAGYENGNITRILDVLREERVPGAFFVLENLITRNTDVVKRMAAEGHLVCNHTKSHKDMTKCKNVEEFEAELKALEDIYREYIGLEMAPFYRPPEGRFNEEGLVYAERLGYTTVFWSFAYADWDNGKQPDAASSKRKILDNTHNGEILLLHPTSATNADILADLIHEWKRMGYRFGCLTEISAGMEDGRET